MRFKHFMVVALIGSLSVSAASAQDTHDPESVVRAYADAASRGDLEAFLGLYHPSIRKYRFPGQLTSEGSTHNREAYARSFAANPDLRVEIVDLIALGDKVMVRDRVTGLAGGGTSEELTVYQVQDGLITNIVYVERVVW